MKCLNLWVNRIDKKHGEKINLQIKWNLKWKENREINKISSNLAKNLPKYNEIEKKV